VVATAGGMAVGMTLGQVVLGDDTASVPLLLRGLLTGAAIGVPQALLLRGVLPTPVIWAAVVTVGWAVAWSVTAAFGIDLARKWAVFGTSGALVFQLATGLTLAYLLGRSARTRAPGHARRPVAAGKGS
jgi:hypothetical protein